MPLSSKCEDAFTTSGFRRWKKATESFRKHENSNAHKESILKFQGVLKNHNILEKLNDQSASERSLASRCLVEIFTTLQYLGRQGISIRGHTTVDSNFQQLLKLRTRDNKELSQWLTRKTKWTSAEIQNEIIEIMAQFIVRKMSADIKERKYFAIQADETADQSRIEQMCVSIRSVTDSLEAEENILGLYALDECNSASITQALMDVLLRLGLNIADCRGQCYDGASAMSGHLSGVAARLSQLEVRAVYTHCQMHSLNLAVQDTVGGIPFLRDFLSLAKDLIVFLRHSPKRCTLVQNIAAQMGCEQTHIRPFCPTRFSMSYHAFSGLKKQVTIIPEALAEISKNVADDKIKATASGFEKQLDNFHFYFSLCVSHSLFELTDTLSKQLQSPSISAGEGLALCGHSKATLQKRRNDGKRHGCR